MNKETPEMLHVEKWKVQDMRSYNLDVLKHDPTHKGALLLEQSLKHLFGNKCLPDKRNEDNFAKPEKTNNPTISSTDSVKNSQEAEVETQKYKFKIGDKVVVKGVTNPDLNDRIAFISGFPNEYYPYFKVTFPEGTWTDLLEKYLEPYTEETASNPENEIADQKSEENLRNMEEKELDLTQLLKGCEGNYVFSISLGKVLLHEIREQSDNRPIRIERNGNIYYRFANGKCGRDGLVDLYPSEELLRKYPLDAPTAWQIWSEWRKPKRWTPQIGERIFWVNANLTVSQDLFNDFETQRKRRAVGNEFKTGKLAQQAAEEVRKCLIKFHETIQKK